MLTRQKPPGIHLEPNKTRLIKLAAAKETEHHREFNLCWRLRKGFKEPEVCLDREYLDRHKSNLTHGHQWFFCLGDRIHRVRLEFSLNKSSSGLILTRRGRCLAFLWLWVIFVLALFRYGHLVDLFCLVASWSWRVLIWGWCSIELCSTKKYHSPAVCN